MEELIITKASDLFFRYGLKRISMDDLSREAGVSKKTIYQFVSDKNELVMEVVRRLVRCHDKALAQCRRQAANAVEEVALQARLPFATLAAINHSFFYDLERFFPEAWQVVLQHRNEHLLPHIIANLERGLAEGVYRADVDLNLTPQIRLQQLQSVLKPSVLTGVLPNLESLISRLSRFYLQAITNSKGSRMIEKYLNEKNTIKLEQ